MKKYMLIAVILPMFSILSPIISHADNTLSAYTGLKVGYNYLMLGNNSSLDEIGSAPLNYKAGSAPAISLGFVTGITIPLTTKLAIRPAFEYTFLAPTATKLNTHTPSIDVELNTFVPKINVNGLFANIYMDFYLEHNIYLYAGGGIGVSILSYKMEAPLGTNNTTKTNFSWNAGVGAGYYITENVLLDLGVRYIDFGSSKEIALDKDPTTLIFSKIDFSDIEVLLTIAYKF